GRSPALVSVSCCAAVAAGTGTSKLSRSGVTESEAGVGPPWTRPFPASVTRCAAHPAQPISSAPAAGPALEGAKVTSRVSLACAASAEGAEALNAGELPAAG